MKSICLKNPGEIEVTELSTPIPSAGEALIKVKSVGICGSDIGAFRGINPMISYPRVLGHEVAGEIVSIPNNKKGLKPGDRVILDPYIYCGKCYPCSLGRTNCCVNLKVVGIHADGGMAEYITHPADMLVKAPSSLSWELIPLAEPLVIALHSLNRAKLSAGEHIAITGAGPIGLLTALSAIAYGAIPILIDPLAQRLEKAREMGVKHTIHVGSEDVLATITNITDGRLAEVVVEASGAGSAIVSAIEIVCHAGRVVFVGWPKSDTPIPTDKITRKELDVLGSRNGVGNFDEAIEMIESGKVDVRGILTKTVSLDEMPQTIREIDANPENSMKIVGVFE